MFFYRIRRIFEGIRFTYYIIRNLIAYSISLFVLFGIPYYFGKLVWMSPVTGDFSGKIGFLLILTGLWYLLLRVAMAPLWFVSWANVAMLVHDLTMLYERVTGREVKWIRY